MIYIPTGAALPLSFQLPDENPTLYARARILNPSGEEVNGSPVTLTHSSKGNYVGSFIMQNFPWMMVVYEAFTDAQFTQRSSIYSCYSEVYGALQAGYPLPIFVQARDGFEGLYPRATVTDANGVAIPGSPFDLSHKISGNYLNSVGVMPNTPWVKVVTEIYTNPQHTITSNVYGTATEILALSGGGTGDGSGGSTIVNNNFTRTTMTINGYSPAKKYVFTRGDSITFQFTAAIDVGVRMEPYNLAGATFETYLLGKNNQNVVIPHSQHWLGTSQGQFNVQILSSDSEALTTGQNLSVVTKVTQGSTVLHFRTARFLTILDSELHND